jgi:hypothetical protein
MPQPWVAYNRSSNTTESSWQITIWPSLHSGQCHSAINTVYTVLGLCQNMGHGLTCLWQGCNMGRNIIVVRAHIKCASQWVGIWDTARLLLGILQLSLLVISWPMIEVQVQVISAIQRRMTFLNLYEANFGKLWLIMNVALHSHGMSQ